MSDFSLQIQRIKNKLTRAKEVDVKFKVFGASSHKYKIGPPISINQVIAFEKRYHLQLPRCYRAFILNVGNGGDSYQNSGAGPYYGIYPFGEAIDALVYGNPEQYLRKIPTINPNMSNRDWEELILLIEDDDISDENYVKEVGKIYGGILPLGFQGCSSIHGLILNGPYRGRVVNLELAMELKPTFAFDNNFLNWYERWLDEIISGKLIQKSPNWFGHLKKDKE